MDRHSCRGGFFPSLEWKALLRNHFRDKIHAQAVVIDWCYTFYNHQRWHSAADGYRPSISSSQAC